MHDKIWEGLWPLSHNAEPGTFSRSQKAEITNVIVKGIDLAVK